METFLSILVALLAFLFLITVHEIGHYIVGKILKFKINEFSVGFGPAIFKKKKKNGELISLRLIPLGGYCAFAGEGEENSERDAFENQKPYKRILVLLAGAFFNLVTAIVFLIIFFMCYGNHMPQITKVYPLIQYPQHFQEGDVLLEIEGNDLFINIDNDIAKLLAGYGDEVSVTVLRKGVKEELVIRKGEYLTEEGRKNGYGISFAYKSESGALLTKIYRHRYDFPKAAANAFVFTGKVVSKTFEVIGGVFSGRQAVKGSIGGPITAIASMTSLSKTGFDGILYGICVLSVSLAIMNLLPLPSLDGLKVIFTAVEWVRRKPMNKKTESIIHTVGIIVLLALVVILDLINIFG